MTRGERQYHGGGRTRYRGEDSKAFQPDFYRLNANLDDRRPREAIPESAEQKLRSAIIKMGEEAVCDHRTQSLLALTIYIVGI